MQWYSCGSKFRVHIERRGSSTISTEPRPGISLDDYIIEYASPEQLELERSKEVEQLFCHWDLVDHEIPGCFIGYDPLLTPLISIGYKNTQLLLNVLGDGYAITQGNELLELFRLILSTLSIPDYEPHYQFSYSSILAFVELTLPSHLYQRLRNMFTLKKTNKNDSNSDTRLKHQEDDVFFQEKPTDHGPVIRLEASDWASLQTFIEIKLKPMLEKRNTQHTTG
ncbi:hypothetical protein GMRT_11889 [Giardia muris]|uniref:Uncharacterized protein n=1 Tax=Giardia muris TaxID=5742 RepID=A0A4Z1SRI2_GIAMU|nr:hypothetical protein GMRT_11889 [Giardia muris]|eukprot:TNJ28502.1 hypothetical protein GMRT_11889 [Giardia muris]